MEQPKLNLAAIEAQIEQWLQTQPHVGNEIFIAEMLRTVLKLARDETSRGDLKILNRALKELRYAFRIFGTYRSTRKVSLFGSTRITENDPYYLMAKNLGRQLAEAGFMVITGAGPGIMQAGHEGAGRENSFGVNIRLPSVQKANRFIRDDPKLMTFHFFFTRKLMFVKEADAFIFFPGGYGTQDELIEVLTLAQTGKSQLVPIILMDLPDNTYWSQWQKFVRDTILSRGYISEEELRLFKVVNDVEAAVGEIRAFYRNYHSSRYVRHNLVIRLNRPPAPGLVDRLNHEFQDILTNGPVRQTEPLPDESDESATLYLSRLLVPFNREDFARLRQMIDVINQEG
jgi:uncharacterized protein (TIGR00730 family)